MENICFSGKVSGVVREKKKKNQISKVYVVKCLMEIVNYFQSQMFASVCVCVCERERERERE